MTNLMIFCDEDSMRAFMTDPVVLDGYRYYTDGHVCVRTPVCGKIANTKLDNEKIAHNLKTYFEDRDFSVCVPAKFSEIPDVETEECDSCFGTGVDSSCPECLGHGEVTFKNQYNTYTIGCDTCDGKGSVKQLVGDECEYCKGVGSHVLNDGSPVEIGMTRVCVRTARKMEILDNLAVGLSKDMVVFTFKDGQGVTLPIKDI